MYVQQDQSELILEADFLWREIRVGDDIYLDSDLYQNNARALCKGVPYQVLAKLESVCGAQTLVVQSYQSLELVPVSPYLVCSYDIAKEPVTIS